MVNLRAPSPSDRNVDGMFFFVSFFFKSGTCLFIFCGWSRIDEWSINFYNAMYKAYMYTYPQGKRCFISQWPLQFALYFHHHGPYGHFVISNLYFQFRIDVIPPKHDKFPLTHPIHPEIEKSVKNRPPNKRWNACTCWDIIDQWFDNWDVEEINFQMPHIQYNAHI